MDTSQKLQRIKEIKLTLAKLASPCMLCAHKCKVDRQSGEKGICRAGSKHAVYSYSPHHGEEPPISGQRGSGTIFFTHCNMQCVYCQNYSFSQESDFEEIEIEELARRMLELAHLGCHNINLVSPTHYAYPIVQALEIAFQKGLDIPIVYNTGGYDSPELIKLLNGIVDIYLTDIRYTKSEMAIKYSNASRYAENSRLITKEMFGQVGVLKIDGEGIAKKGVIVRLLILPEEVSGTTETLHFLKNEISENIFLSIMSQYHPTYKAQSHSQIARRITRPEHKRVIDTVEELGFPNGWIQGFQTDHERFLGTNIKPS